MYTRGTSHKASYIGLQHYLAQLGEFHDIEVIVMETNSRFYKVHLHNLQDMEHLTHDAIFNVQCNDQ